MVQMAKA